MQPVPFVQAFNPDQSLMEKRPAYWPRWLDACWPCILVWLHAGLADNAAMLWSCSIMHCSISPMPHRQQNDHTSGQSSCSGHVPVCAEAAGALKPPLPNGFSPVHPAEREPQAAAEEHGTQEAAEEAAEAAAEEAAVQPQAAKGPDPVPELVLVPRPGGTNLQFPSSAMGAVSVCSALGSGLTGFEGAMELASLCCQSQRIANVLCGPALLRPVFVSSAVIHVSAMPCCLPVRTQYNLSSTAQPAVRRLACLLRRPTALYHSWYRQSCKCTAHGLQATPWRPT